MAMAPGQGAALPPPRRRPFFQMSDFPVEVPDSGDPMAAAMESLHKSQVVSANTSSTASTSSVQATQMLANSSSTSTTSSSSRVAKTSSTATSSASSTSRMHSVQEMKASSMKSDLCELKSSITEMKNLSASSASLTAVGFGRLRSSLEDLDATTTDEVPVESDPIVTFPDDSAPPTPAPGTASLGSPAIDATSSAASISSFEQKRRVTASKTQMMQESFSAEQATRADRSEVTRVMGSASSSYSEQSAQAAVRRRLEVDGLSAEDALAVRQEQRTMKAGEITQQETRDLAAASMKMHTDTFTSEKKAMSAQQQRQTMTTTGMYNHEKHMASSQSNFTITTAKGMHTKAVVSAAQQMSQLLNGSGGGGGGGPGSDDDILNSNFDDLERLSANSSPVDVERAITKYSHSLDAVVKSLRRPGGVNNAPKLLGRVNEMMQKAWAVPTHGHELGYTLCNALRTCGGLDLLMSNCASADGEMQFASARLLEQCLTTENRAHVVENGLEKVVKVACGCTRNSSSVDHSRTATGILEHLFKHSEGTCSDVIKLGGLDAVLFECRKNDVETLRHCAGALANLSLYGGAENQEAMIKRKVPMWLFPLAFHNDDNIKYYACLAIAVLVANKEIEAAVLKSGTLDLVEPFVTTHNPSEFAKSNLAHAHGQSKHWLQRLVPVLSSKREEARNLAAFHFCMEAGIKRQQGNTELFREIGAIEPLKKVASCPNAVASKYAAQALRLIGEEVPHKLSQQVPLWSTEDVREWVRQIGFPEYASNFVESRVDGDLLLQLTEGNLREDIGISNGIRRRRFTRELQNLKKMADYSSRDIGNLNMFLQSIAPEFSIYTYSMLNAGVDTDSLRRLTEDHLLHECGIPNSIHRLRILESIRVKESDLAGSRQEDIDKCLDVFVSYRRSNGSQLASLLKVHLQLRGFTVFIDVERLEAGKFDNNLLQSIRTARHFLLVLTPRALERCIGDTECKDWVHREIVAALQSNCNIIPIIDNFTWPEPEELPEDMRAVCHFNGVRWIHDYQDACVDKLERFMRGELNIRQGVGSSAPKTSGGPVAGDATPGTPGSLSRQPPQYQRMVSSDSSKGSDKDRGD